MSTTASRHPEPRHAQINPDQPLAPASKDQRADIEPGIVANSSFFQIPVRLIDRDPSQPRAEFDEESIRALGESLRDFGQIQPIVVRPSETPGRFILVAGERRWRAAGRIGLERLAALLLDVHPRRIDETSLRLFQLAENLAREDLDPIDQARAFQELMARNGWSGRQLAAHLRIRQSVVARALNLLSLPAEIRDEVAAGRLAPRSALKTRKHPRANPNPATPTPTLLPNEPSSTRAFDTTFGRVTIEPIDPGGFVEIAGAIEEAARWLCAERAVERSSRSSST